MQRIVGSRLPTSREATLYLRRPSYQMVMVGTPLERRMKFLSGQLVHISYKYPWLKRHWYTIKWRRGKWKGPDGQLQS